MYMCAPGILSSLSACALSYGYGLRRGGISRIFCFPIFVSEMNSPDLSSFRSDPPVSGPRYLINPVLLTTGLLTTPPIF